MIDQRLLLLGTVSTLVGYDRFAAASIVLSNSAAPHDNNQKPSPWGGYPCIVN